MVSVLNKHPSLKLLPFVILGFLIYSNTLDVPFYLDDLPNISQNPRVRLTKLDKDQISNGRFSASTRPVTEVSFALNYYFHRNNVTGYHVVNIFVHVLTGLFLYFFLQTTIRVSARQSRNPPIPQSVNPSTVALFAALLWLAHPIQTQSVTYVVQRGNSLAALFYVLCLLSYTKGRLAGRGPKAWSWFAGCAASGMLAIGSKQIAATLPFFIFLYEWYFIQDLSGIWIRRRLPYVIGILVLLGLLAFFHLGSNPMERILSGYKDWDFTLKIFKHLEDALENLVKKLEKERRVKSKEKK